jgi:hypothetical protein
MLMVSWKERVSGMDQLCHLWVCFDVGGVFGLGFRLGIGFGFGFGFGLGFGFGFGLGLGLGFGFILCGT